MNRTQTSAKFDIHRNELNKSCFIVHIEFKACSDDIKSENVNGKYRVACRVMSFIVKFSTN